MDMQIPQPLLQIARPPRPDSMPGGLEHFFSEQLSARYDVASRSLWIRWTPRPRPSFNPALLRALDQCAQFIRTDQGHIRVAQNPIDCAPDLAEGELDPLPIEYTVLASGVPGTFNLGGDLDLFVRLIEARDRASLVEYGSACVHVLYQNYSAHGLPITTISLVQGECLGGGFEAALSSDIVVAEKNARFGFPEILFNLFPGMGAYSFLARRVGQKVTEHLISTGRTHSADDMLQMGVIDHVTEAGQGEAEVAALIRRQSRSRNGLSGIARVRRRVNPVSLRELLDVVDLWADCALGLSNRDLRLMQRLVARQNEINSGQHVH